MTLLSYAAIYVIWGSTFLAIRLAIDSIPPLLMMGARCVAAGALLVLWAAVRGERTGWVAWRHAAIAGVLMFACTYGGLAWAEERIASGVAALLVATVPLWMTVFKWAGRRFTPSRGTIAGLALGFGGVALLVWRGLSPSMALIPAAVILLGEITWAAGALYARPPRLPDNVALNAGMPLLTGGVALVAASYGTHELQHFNPHAVSMVSLAALLYLIIFGSIVAFSAYAWLMQVAPASRVSTHAYVNPLIAVALGGAVGGEPFTPAIAASSLVIAAGVAVVLAAK